MDVLAPSTVPRKGWFLVRWWALALAGATVLGLLSWLQMRTEIPPNLRTDYRIAAVLSWLLWVPVLAVLGRPVRRLISVGARPAVLVGALLAGFLGVMVYINAGQALVSRFAGPPTVRKMPVGRVFLRNFKGIVGPGINYLAIVGILGPSSSGAGCGRRPWPRRRWRPSWPGPSWTRCESSSIPSCWRTRCGRPRSSSAPVPPRRRCSCWPG